MNTSIHRICTPITGPAKLHTNMIEDYVHCAGKRWHRCVRPGNFKSKSVGLPTASYRPYRRYSAVGCVTLD